MKYRYLTALWGLTMMVGVQASHLQVSFDDIVLLNQRGVSEQTLLLFLENRTLTFDLDATMLDKLMETGVSEKVIRYLVSQIHPEKTPPDTAQHDPPPESAPSTTYVSYPVYPAYFYTPYYYDYSYVYGRSYYSPAWFGPHYPLGHSAKPHALPISHGNGLHAGDNFEHHKNRHHNNSNVNHNAASRQHRANTNTGKHGNTTKHRTRNDHHNNNVGHTLSGRHKSKTKHDTGSKQHRAGHSASSKRQGGGSGSHHRGSGHKSSHGH